MSEDIPAKKPRAHRVTDTTKAKAKVVKIAPKKVAKADAPAKPVKVKAPKATDPAAMNLSGTSTDALRLKAPTYVHDKEKRTAGGHVSVHNGDEMAVKLLGKPLDVVYAQAAKTLKEPETELRNKYAHLNPGMQRMCLGNRMRAAVAR